MGRADMPEADRRPFYLYVDEFQNYASLSFGTILSEARKWRLNLVLANQFLAQLPQALRDAVLGNIGTLVVFRIGASDAQILAAELDIKMPSALTDTPNFEAWVKLLRNGVPSSAIPIRTSPAHISGGRLSAVISRTRARYARPREKVESAIAAFLRP